MGRVESPPPDRRAIVLFLRDGLAATGTDQEAVMMALANVVWKAIELNHSLGANVAERVWELLKCFPPLPATPATTHQHKIGHTAGDLSRQLLGYGWVVPHEGGGHLCGVMLFVPETQAAYPWEPYLIPLADLRYRH